MSNGTTNLLNWFGIIGGLGGLAALIKVLIDRTKVRTDAVDQIADTSVQLLAPMREEISRLRESLREAEVELADLRKRVRIIADRGDEADTIRTKLSASEESVRTLRVQIHDLYDELAEKDRAIAERDRLIADLRAGRQAS